MNKLQHLDALYSRLPKIECKKLCGEAYCGVVPMTALERQRITNRVGDLKSCGLSCPLFKDGLCSVYHIRPIICRVWGLVRKMACPHGCKPERWLTDREAMEFFEEASKIGGPLDLRMVEEGLLGKDVLVFFAPNNAADFEKAAKGETL